MECLDLREAGGSRRGVSGYGEHLYWLMAYHCRQLLTTHRAARLEKWWSRQTLRTPTYQDGQNYCLRGSVVASQIKHRQCITRKDALCTLCLFCLSQVRNAASLIPYLMTAGGQKFNGTGFLHTFTINISYIRVCVCVCARK